MSDISRRHFLRGLAVAAGAVPLARIAGAGAAELPKLPESDPTAKALGYVENGAALTPQKEASFKAGSSCANCLQYVAAEAKGGYGPCKIFPGKSVAAKGWCRAWVATA